ncbi:MAG: hypothetical protein LBB23_03285 [Rickettsiales bacterium]|jgi:nucleoside-diphosphate kinase|nr:hypothetical protein [Rickettsiales bacterium]
MHERTLVILKPDAIARGLAGKIITAIEDCGLKITDAKLMTASRLTAEQHYNGSQEFLNALGVKAIENAKSKGEDIIKKFGTENPAQIGAMIRTRILNYITEGPVMPMIAEGNDAVRVVRKLIGATNPVDADPSTIRGKYCTDSLELSSREGRATRNLVHASGNVAEAAAEIPIWF